MAEFQNFLKICYILYVCDYQRFARILRNAGVSFRKNNCKKSLEVVKKALPLHSQMKNGALERGYMTSSLKRLIIY